MPTNYTIEGWARLDSVSINGGSLGQPGTTLSWSAFSTPSDTNSTVTDRDDDANLDAGPGEDYLGNNGVSYYTGYTITSGGDDYPIFHNPNVGGFWFVPLPVDGTGQTIIPSSGTSNVYESKTPVADTFMCFAPGTWIDTVDGERLVESLSVGDMVTTQAGQAVPILWIGRQTIYKCFAKERARLVRISAGTFGAHSDLRVTADHGLVVAGYVINAAALVNGTSVRFEPLSETPEVQTVYHIATAAHEVLLANGAAVESYLDQPGVQTFDNHADYRALSPEPHPAEIPLPRIVSARLLPAQVRAELGLETGMRAVPSL